jgi:MinD-like ATPase involved in chromosome partitioning or flagellar assembly
VIGVIGGKGGVGKTTSAMVIASILAKYRAKPVCLITLDHNQTLALRTKTVTDSARGDMSLADFVSDPDIIRVSPERSSRVARYMKTNPQRLNVLGTGIDALHRQVLTAQDFNTALDILKGCYEIIVIDFGPPNTESYWAALESLNALVMVTSAENDSMRGVAQVENYVRESGLTTLIDHGTIDLVCRRNGVTKKHRDVLEIPYDEHLSESGPIALDLMNKNTVYQYTIAAKLVMDRV